ncbi:MAG: ATPase [Gammaproteobacteria bacterium]|nr:MAG: ATPase [Gammaproteobacteria bacterium]
MVESTAETLIGYVTDVQSGSMLASLINDEPSSSPIITIGDQDILIGQIGSYVLITQEQTKALAMVTRMTEQEKFIPAEPGQNREDVINDPLAIRTITLVPLGRLNTDGEFVRGIGVFPTTGAEVHAIGADIIGAMFNRFQSKGYDVGYLPTNENQKVYFDPSSLFGRHFTILGQTGAGKSYTVANILQRAVATMPKAHIVLLDLHGEYSWIDKDSSERQYAFDEGVARYVDARKLEIPYWLMTYAELCDLLIDHSEREAANQTAFFRDNLLELRLLEKVSLGLDRISVDTPVYFSLDDLVEKVREENSRMVQGATKLIKGPMHGNFDRFLIRLESKLNDIRYDFLLKPQVRNSSDTLEGLLRDFVGLGEPKAPITIIDLSSVPFDVRPIVAAQIGRLAFEFNYWNPEYKEFPLLLLCEEAHAYIPRDSSAAFSGARKSMERIAKEGRKYGVGLGVVSQRPHELSETVLAQCGTFLCLRITNPTDQSYVRNLVPEAERDLMDILAGLGRGECMAMGEAVPLPTRVQFYRPNPSPNSDDIDFHDKWINGPDDLDVASIVNKWRRQERSE